MRAHLVLISFLFIQLNSFPQDLRFAGLWIGYSEQIHFNTLDYSCSISNLINIQSKRFQNIDYPASDIRLQIVNMVSYKPKNCNLNFGFGIQYQRNYPFDARFTNEIRPFEQMEYRRQFGALFLGNVLRFNQRFVLDKESSNSIFTLGSQYRTIARYNFKKATFHLLNCYLTAFSEEYFLFTGPLKYQFFSEYWAYIGLGMEWNRKNRLEFGVGHEFMVRNASLQKRSIWYPAFNWLTKFDFS